MSSRIAKSEQEAWNTIAGNEPDIVKSDQEVVADDRSVEPYTAKSVQRMFAEQAGQALSAETVQKMMFDNLKDGLGLTGAYVSWTVQKMLNMALAAGYTIENIITGSFGTNTGKVLLQNGTDALLLQNGTDALLLQGGA